MTRRTASRAQILPRIHLFPCQLTSFSDRLTEQGGPGLASLNSLASFKIRSKSPGHLNRVRELHLIGLAPVTWFSRTNRWSGDGVLWLVKTWAAWPIIARRRVSRAEIVWQEHREGRVRRRRCRWTDSNQLGWRSRLGWVERGRTQPLLSRILPFGWSEKHPGNNQGREKKKKKQDRKKRRCIG